MCPFLVDLERVGLPWPSLPNGLPHNLTPTLSLAILSHLGSVCPSLRLSCLTVTHIQHMKHACRSWSERHAHTAEQLRHGSAQELQLDAHFWLSSECRAPLGESLGSPAVPEQILAGHMKQCEEGRAVL